MSGVPRPTAGAIARWRGQLLEVVVVAVLAAQLAIFAESATRDLFPWINHDCAWNLVLGEQVLRRHTVLYVDLLDTNPPAIIYLEGIVAILARALGVPVVLAFYVMVLAFAAFGAWWLLRGLAAQPVLVRWVVTIAYLYVAVRGGILAADYGQREHIFALLLIPYVMWRACGPAATRFDAVGLVLLGYLSATKPPLFPAIVLVCEIVRPPEGITRVRIWALLLGGLFASLVILGLHSPASLVGLFVNILPMHLGGAYAGWGRHPTEGERWYLVMWIVNGVGVVGTLLALAVRRSMPRRVAVMLLGVIAACNFVFFIQGKDWSYHATVSAAAALVLGAYAWSTSLSRIPWRVVRFVPLALLVATLALATIAAQGALRRSLELSRPPITAFTPILHGRGRIMFATEGLDHAIGALYWRVDAVGRYAHRFQIESIVANPDLAERHAEIQAFARGLEEEIAQYRPNAILFSPSTTMFEEPYKAWHEVLRDEGGLALAPAFRLVEERELQQCCGSSRYWAIYVRVIPKDRAPKASRRPRPG